MDFGALANTRRWKVDIQRGPLSQCCFNQQENCFNIDGLFTSISLLSHHNLVRFFSRSKQ